MAVANAPVPETADMSIKIPVNLKLQPSRHIDTLIFTSMHLMYLMIHFLCRKLKKIIVSEKFFQIWHLFIFYRYCNYKQIRWRYTSSAFLELKVPVFKTDLNYKQIRWQYTDNKFFRTPITGTWTPNKSNDGIPVTHFQGFNAGIFGKTTPLRFVENDDQPKSVLN